jgi:hypothetical protein
MIGLGLVAGAGKTASAPVNLVVNPSFTTNSITGWSGNEYAPVVRYTETFRTAPACLNYDQGDGNANAMYDRASVLTIGQPYSLSIWLKTLNAQPFTITFDAGLTRQVLTTSTQSGSAPFTNYKIENITCTGATSLKILVESSFGGFIDDVSVVQGATA